MLSNRTHAEELSLRVTALAGNRGAIATLIAFSLSVNLISFAGPIFSLQVFDRVLNSQSVETLALLLLITVFLLGLQAFVEGVRSRLLVRIGTRFDAAISPYVFDFMVRAGIAAPRHAGHANAVRDLDQVRECLAGPPAVAFLDAPWIPLYLAACFAFHPLIGWTVFGCGVSLAGLAWINDAVTRKPLRNAQEGALIAAERASASHRHGDVLQALGMTGAVRSRWTLSRDATLGWQALASDRTGATAAAGRLVRLLVPVAATAVGAWLVIKGEITPGILIASSIIASRALLPIDQLVTSWRGFQSARLAWERLRELQRVAGTVRAPMALPAPAGQIDVLRLVAVPPGSSRPALRSVAFSLEAGDALGVVGPSGSGKSTLARALVGLLAPLAGEVRFDGARIDQWDSESLGRHIGYLPQDSALMAGSIAENISRFCADATAESVVATAKAADAHEMILDLPQGYETVIGAGGESLSGGQRQRIASARALFGDPAIVVLDEPNAALDSAGEDALLLALQTLKKRRCTVIIMTHRMGVLGAVDKLLILENGLTRAFGARDEVIARVNAEAAANTGRQCPAVVRGGRP